MFLTVTTGSATLTGNRVVGHLYGPARLDSRFRRHQARAVDVQVQVAPGLPAFNIVGLPDKAVSEAKERVRAALVASGLALPAR